LELKLRPERVPSNLENEEKNRSEGRATFRRGGKKKKGRYPSGGWEGTDFSYRGALHERGKEMRKGGRNRQPRSKKKKGGH